MSGCNDRAVTVPKTEAIVSYQHTKKALISSVSARDQGCFVSVVVLRRRFPRQPAFADRGHSVVLGLIHVQEYFSDWMFLASGISKKQTRLR
jgi:hypothetical protein